MKKMLVIGVVWPEPKTTAAGERMLQLLQAFNSIGYHITFASTASKNSHSHDLGKMRITEKSILLNDISFDEFIKELQPDFVVFDRFMVEEQFGWRVAEYCPKALRILNTEDLHSLREFRQQCFKKDIAFELADYIGQDKTKRELASIYRSDFTLLVSSFEQEFLVRELGLPQELLLHLPFMLPRIEESDVKQWPEFEKRTDFIAYGNGKHAPNVDSFRYLKKDIWPLIRKELPQARLHIYGGYLPQQLTEMHQPKEGFLVHGWVEALEEKVREAKVVLAPLNFGAGIKGKLTMAMQCGTPSVTTNIGAEGMAGELPWGGIICNTPEAIAQAAIALYQNAEQWYVCQRKGKIIINSLYHKDMLQNKLRNRLEELATTLVAHRNTNLVGALLQHQSMAATKYMGKWIEEKGKKSK